MQVIPLAATRVNWDEFIRVIKEQYECSPTKALDDENIKTSGLLSFPLVMNLDKKVNYNLLDESSRLEHTFISFLVITAMDVNRVNKFSNLRIYEVVRDDGTYITILTGSLADWRAAVYNGIKYRGKMQELFKEIYMLMSHRIGAFQLWQGRWSITI